MPPSATELETILAWIRMPLRLPLIVAEQPALRVGEVRKLAWATSTRTAAVS